MRHYSLAILAAGIASCGLVPTAGFAQSSAELERQKAELDERIRLARIAEAKEALRVAQENLRRAEATPAAQQTASRASETPPTPPPPAEGSAEQPATSNPASGDRPSQDASGESKTNGAKFGGIDFGIGISFSYDFGGERRIREASVVNGLVRVTEADNARARLILESHYFFTPNGRFPFGLTNRDCLDLSGNPIEKCVSQHEWGFGPFVALQPGSGAIIDAVGAGLMFGFRRPGEGNDSFNFGVGMLYDLDVRVLGPDIVANQPLPVGETDVRFQRREQSSILFLTSFSF